VTLSPRTFNPPIREPVGEDLAILVKGAGPSRSAPGGIVAQLEVFNGTAVYADNCEISAAKPSQAFIDAVQVEYPGVDRAALKAAILKLAHQLPELLRRRDRQEGAAAPTDEMSRDGLPPIVTTNRPLRDITRDALAALRAANTPPVVFVRSAELTCVQVDEKERPVIRPLVEAALRGRLERSANYVTVKTLKSGDTATSHTPPPLDVVRDVAHLYDEWDLPPLEGIIEAPVLRSDGSILDASGYDCTSRLVYKPVSGLRIPPIPESPTAEDVTRALEIVDEAIGDFPFSTSATYANALGLLLTPIVRQMTDEPVPMALIDAPMAGTGKGLLGEVVALIATGRPAGTTPEVADEDEMRKRITSLMRDGTTVVTIDNVQHRLEASSLASVLTARVWRERVLGQTGTQEWPQRATWIATGNNIQLGGDLARRCYWIRLDSGLEEPWRRATEGFRHHPLLPWVAEHRGELLAALLVLARSWYAAGRPQPEVRPTLGSFETWSATISGILAHAGVPDFLGNLDDLYSRNSDERSEWQAFLLAWQERYSDAPTLLAKVQGDVIGDHPVCQSLRDALPGTLGEAAANGHGSFTRRLGKALGQHADQPFGSVRVVRAGQDGTTKVLRWKVTQTPGPSSSNRGFRGLYNPELRARNSQTDAHDAHTQNTRMGDGLEQTPETPGTGQFELEIIRGLRDETPDDFVEVEL
jgi:hypothetical protein